MTNTEIQYLIGRAREIKQERDALNREFLSIQIKLKYQGVDIDKADNNILEMSSLRGPEDNTRQHAGQE